MRPTELQHSRPERRLRLSKTEPFLIKLELMWPLHISPYPHISEGSGPHNKPADPAFDPLVEKTTETLVRAKNEKQVRATETTLTGVKRV